MKLLFAMLFAINRNSRSLLSCILKCHKFKSSFTLSTMCKNHEEKRNSNKRVLFKASVSLGWHNSWNKEMVKQLWSTVAYSEFGIFLLSSNNFSGVCQLMLFFRHKSRNSVNYAQFNLFHFCLAQQMCHIVSVLNNFNEK